MKIFVTFLLISILSGCHSSKVGSKVLNIEGNWRWIEKSGGFAGRKTTPESTNQQMSLQITKDSMFYYTSGELVSKQAYQLVRSQSLLDKKDHWTIKGSEPKVLIDKTDNFLIIREDCYDCFINKYEKSDGK